MESISQLPIIPILILCAGQLEWKAYYHRKIHYLKQPDRAIDLAWSVVIGEAMTIYHMPTIYKKLKEILSQGKSDYHQFWKLQRI